MADASSNPKKLKNLEKILQEINKRHVRIKKQERKNNNCVLYTVLEELLKGMRKCDPLFNSMKPKLEYLGKYEDALGTYMFFEEDPVPKTEDPLFDKLAEKNLKYLCKTQKCLNMEHAYVTPREGHVIQNPKQDTDEEIDAINFSTLQEAIDKFKNHWDVDPTIGVDNN